MDAAVITERLRSNRWRWVTEGDRPGTGGSLLTRMIPQLSSDEVDALRSRLLTCADGTTTVGQTVAIPAAEKGRTVSGTYRQVAVRVEYGPSDPRDPRSDVGLNLYQDLIIAADLTATGTGVSDAYQEDAFEKLDLERHTDQSAALSDVTPQVAGTVVRVENEKDPVTGLFKTEKTTETSIPQAAAAGEAGHDAFETRAMVEGKNIVLEPTLPSSQTAGTVVTLLKRLNRFLRWDKVETTETAVVQAAAGAEAEHQAFETRATAEGKNIVTEPTLPSSQTAGTIVTALRRLNRFLRWDKVETTRTAVVQAAAAGEAVFEAYQSEAVVEGKNIVTEPTLPTSQTAGTVVRLRKMLNLFLRWDTVQSTETSIPQAAAAGEKEITPVETLEIAEGRNIVTEPTLPTSQTAGVAVRMRKGVNRFLRWDQVVVTRTAVNLEWDWTWETQYGTAHGWKGLNVTEAQYLTALAMAALSASAPGDVRKEKSRVYKDLFDYSISKVPIGATTGGGSASDWEGFGTDDYGTAVSPLRDIQNRRYLVHVKRTNSQSGAEAFVNGENTSDYVTTGHFGKWGTGAWYMGRGRWTAVAVEVHSADIG